MAHDTSGHRSDDRMEGHRPSRKGPTMFQESRQQIPDGAAVQDPTLNVKVLVGSGDKIMLFTLPFLIIGLILNVRYPSLFDVGGPGTVLRVISIIVLILGICIWIWSVVLILAKVPRGELITTGPYSLVKHPLYLAVALLVLPWIGFLLNTWLGAVIGIILYIGTRIFAGAEEEALSKTFDGACHEYANSVRIPWL
jgi:protein-S-isoprenylcysteine O-methyltransferase Ste14